MRAVLFIFFYTVRVRGLVSEGDEDWCSGPVALARMWNLTRAFKENRSLFHRLEDDGCLGQEELDEIEKDPEDAAEYLGDERPRSLISPGLCMRFKRPNTYFIGIGHAGSTTLSRHLERHPQISYGIRKEHDFWKTNVGARWKSFSQYLMEFLVPCRTKVVMDFPPRMYRQAYDAVQEACNYGTWRQRGQPETPLGEPFVRRFREQMGENIKIIMMIRDPYDWLHSGSINGTKIIRKLDNDEELGEQEACRWYGSRYAEAVEQWLKYYPRENFIFLKSEDFFSDPQKTLNKIFKFLNLSHRPYTENELKYHAGRRRAGHKHLMTPELRREFQQHPVVRGDREKLQRLTGETFAWEGA